MDINDLRAALTVLLLVVFLGIVVWAYSRRNKQQFEEMGALPLNEERVPSPLQGARHE